MFAVDMPCVFCSFREFHAHILTRSVRSTIQESTMFHTRPIVGLCLLAASLAAFGCGRQRTFDPTYPVSGTVTVDGRPVSDAEIVFVTVDKGDLQLLPIKEGKYGGQARAGERRVEIRAFRPGNTPLPPPAPPSGGPMVNYLPTRYNDASTLRANVTPEGPNVFNFDLKSE